jgi:hypothetical protein
VTIRRFAGERPVALRDRFFVAKEINWLEQTHLRIGLNCICESTARRPTANSSWRCTRKCQSAADWTSKSCCAVRRSTQTEYLVRSAQTEYLLIKISCGFSPRPICGRQRCCHSSNPFLPTIRLSRRHIMRAAYRNVPRTNAANSLKRSGTAALAETIRAASRRWPRSSHRRTSATTARPRRVWDLR